jgi:hypothetical protein
MIPSRYNPSFQCYAPEVILRGDALQPPRALCACATISRMTDWRPIGRRPTAEARSLP